MNRIERFSDEFTALEQLVEQHAATQNRSLFQVFQENLCLPGLVETHKTNMYMLDSPRSVKTRFAEYLQAIERKSKVKLDEYFADLLEYEVKPQKGGQRGRPRVNPPSTAESKPQS